MPQIHPTALVSDQARLADDVIVGPFAIVDGPAVLGAGCEIGGHVWIRGQVEMGANNRIGYGSSIGTDPQDLSFDPSTTSGVRLGDGNTLRENVTVNRATIPDGFTTIGDDNYLMIGVHLAHDVALGNRNIFANNVLLAGFVEVGNSVFIGGAAVFHQFIRINDFAMIQGLCGAGKDVPPYCVVDRVNRLAGLNVVGLRRGGFSPDERKEIKAAYALLFQNGLATTEALEEAAKREWHPAAEKLIDAVRNPTKRGVLTRSE